MNRLTLLVRLLAGATLLLGAVTSSPVKAQAPSSPQPALWMLRDADSIVYLFGTLHFTRPGTRWRTEEVDAALAASDALVLEIADPEDQAAVAPLIQRHDRSPDRPLSGLLTADEFGRLDRAALAVGASAAEMDTLRPWLAGILL